MNHQEAGRRAEQQDQQKAPPPLLLCHLGRLGWELQEPAEESMGMGVASRRGDKGDLG